MKFVTRKNVKVDRVACPWLIARFVDANAEFLFVEPSQVMAVAQSEGAIPFDVDGVELSHLGASCSFDAVIANTTSPHRASACSPGSFVVRIQTQRDWSRNLTGSKRWPRAFVRSPKTTTKSFDWSSPLTTLCMPTAGGKPEVANEGDPPPAKRLRTPNPKTR